MKGLLQEKIDSGEIGDMAQLLSYVDHHGWSVVRNGVDYLGLENAEGKRFRVRFAFVNPTRKARIRVSRELRQMQRDSLPGYWVYGLFAEHGEDRACYIGQAVDYVRRVKDHMRGREGRSSWDLLRWAEARGVEVEFALLEFVPGQPRTHGPASAAIVIEGLWLQRALAAGFQAPGKDRWGGLPRPNAGVDLRWPEDEVAEARRPLALVIPDRLLPEQVAIRRARERYAILQAMKPISPDGSYKVL